MSNVKVKYRSRIVANWRRMDQLEGRCVEIGVADLEDRKADYMMVETSDGDVQVFKNAGLEDLFKNCAVGDFVKIKFLETTTTSAGRTFHKFQSSCWEDPAAPKLAPRPKTESFRRARKAK